MRAYTQQELDALIGCPKVVTEPPRPTMIAESGQKRNGLKLRSEDSADEFAVFIRINEDFHENFSIGLRHLPVGEESAILLRCNGDHGVHQNQVVNADQIDGVHIHYTTEAALQAGLKLENYAKPTSAYATYEDALRHFLRIINVLHPEKHFPQIYQLPLFGEVGGDR